MQQEIMALQADVPNGKAEPLVYISHHLFYFVSNTIHSQAQRYMDSIPQGQSHQHAFQKSSRAT